MVDKYMVTGSPKSHRLTLLSRRTKCEWSIGYYMWET